MTAPPTTELDTDVTNLTDEEAACVETETGPTLEPTDETIAAAIIYCNGRINFAAPTIQAINDDNPGTYTPEQLACLTEGYSRLPTDDYQTLIDAATNPTSQNRDQAAVTTQQLFQDCAAPIPES